MSEEFCNRQTDDTSQTSDDDKLSISKPYMKGEGEPTSCDGIFCLTFLMILKTRVAVLISSLRGRHFLEEREVRSTAVIVCCYFWCGCLIEPTADHQTTLSQSCGCDDSSPHLLMVFEQREISSSLLDQWWGILLLRTQGMAC